jgi:mannose-6-phosphate isomerase-like protein (cupin superfamily)
VLAHQTLGEDAMARRRNESPAGPIVAGPGAPAIAAVGTSLVVHEWTESGPSWLHIHRSDDEAWHVLEGALRFRFADREVDAPAGTTVFVPAGTAHTYWVTAEPGRYLIFLTPWLDRLIAACTLSPTHPNDAPRLPNCTARSALRDHAGTLLPRASRAAAGTRRWTELDREYTPAVASVHPQLKPSHRASARGEDGAPLWPGRNS